MYLVYIDENTLGIKDCYKDKDFIKSELTGAKWIKDKKMWQVEFSTTNFEKLQWMGCGIPEKAAIEYESKKAIMNEIIEEKLMDKTEPIEKMPIKANPYQHQIKAFNIACKLMKLFKGE